MKIRKIKWKDHPILGDLELSFLKDNDKAYDTVLFAGENGSGKTSILESIANFLIERVTNHIDFIEYENKNENVLARVVGTNPSSSQIPNLTFDKIEEEKSKKKVKLIPISDQTEINEIQPHQFGCVYSKARANFTTSTIQSPRNSTLDTSNINLDDNDDFTPLKQLLVDIDNDDNNEYSRINKELGESPKSWTKYFPDSRTFRFKNAFDSFFENIIYEGASEKANSKELIFLKNKKKIPLDKLSTGEKQIVFRGTHLLRNMKKLNGSIVLIDEPELSMHPKWQRKILDYFKTIVSDKGKQTSQIFLATHSEQVLKGAFIQNKENLPIILYEESGNIKSKEITSFSVLPSPTSAEINYLSFDMVSNDYHIELYGWIQENQKFTKVKECDKFIVKHPKFQKSKHHKTSKFTHPKGGTTDYETLSTYIRNLIDHPKSGVSISEAELRTSIELMIEICKGF